MIGRRSIRARVLGAMFAVLLLTLFIAGLIVDRAFVARQESAIDTVLRQTMSLGQAAASQKPTADSVIVQVTSGDVHANLKQPSGQVAGEPLPGSGQARTLTQPIIAEGPLNGAMLTLWVGNQTLDAARGSLDRTLLLVGLIALIAAGLITVLVVDIALKPLQVMAVRANQIAEGERGIRMAAPTDTTEVGKAAFAIDGMLDELEGAERRARTAEAAAQSSAEQMKAFLSDAAHELKTPLAGIQAAAESLVALPDDADEERDHLSYLLAREANRGAHLVSSLLESARIDAGVDLRKESVSLLDIAQSERHRMSLAQPSVRVLVEGHDVVVEADREAITSVLRNLVDNAGRAASPDGWVVIGVTEGPDHEPAIAVVTVMDSGLGIAPGDRERVFQRLVRLASTATTTKGSGLGLAIARGYARAHGGDIEIVDDPAVSPPLDADGQPARHGAVFQVTVPVTSPNAGAARAAETP